MRSWSAFGLVVISAACANAPAAPRSPALVQAKITIVSQVTTNRGAALHVMIRRVDSDLADDSYGDEVARLALVPPDPSIVATQVVLPGRSAEIPLEVEAEQAVAVMVFFSEPQGRWRALLPASLPSRVRIVLGSGAIDRVEGAP